uniref:Uncharacterized protein n=1 Tax=Periophthalmus magnuspinnatus TaxID=409849 RepID=A0A3B3Z7D5_9GOBI
MRRGSRSPAIVQRKKSMIRPFKKPAYDYQCTGNVQEDFPKLCALLDIKNIPPVHCKSTETEEEELPGETPNLLKLGQTLHIIVDDGDFWKAGLTDEMITSLSNTLSVGSSLRVVYLDGNPLPNHSYHLLLSEDSLINRLFLRNNQIGDEGARLIGSALSTTKTANKNLLFLNLAFNCIGNAGAAYLAQGLRLNRALIYLSLANNQIGDSGAAHISKILGEFPLTHEEVVERRKLLIEKQGLVSVLMSVFVFYIHYKTANGVYDFVCSDFQAIINCFCLFLGNAITEESLPLFLTSLEQQTEGGLLRLCLNRNNFSPDCELFNKINHLLQLRDPKNRPATEPGEDEGHK